LGHKVHPTGFRLGVVKGWQSRWYAERDYKDILAEDHRIRQTIQKELANASVSAIEIERAATNQVAIRIRTAKPGIVIGKSGEKVERLKAHLEALTRKRVKVEIHEIRQPELDAYLVGRSIAEQLEKRVSFRRAMKQAVQKAMRSNAKGIKIIVGGRLGGAEIARSEKEVEGKVPLHTLRADIDYGLAEAHTTFGVIGIKVWIYKGDILPTKRREPGEVQEPLSQPIAQPREERRDRRRDSGPRGDRGPRPQGDRPRGGDRGDRRDSGPRGDRGPRPQGDRPQGDRGPRTPRPQGERSDRPQGDRGPRTPRPQGERSDRPQRPQGERAPREGGERQPREGGERQPREPRVEQQTPPVTNQVTETPAQPTPPPTDTTGTTQSE
jgi:small subunit ribosomal protein S3